MIRRAFTLIELLVVIGIITLLIAIVIPVLTLCRQYAQAVRCASNIRQITASLNVYETNNGAFPYSYAASLNNPPPGGSLGNKAYDKVGWWWINYIMDGSKTDLNSSAMLHCPSGGLKRDVFKDNVLVANYGVNQSVCKSFYGDTQTDEFTGPPLRSTDIRSPDKTILVVDSGYAVLNWYHVTNSPPRALVGESMENSSYLPGLDMNKNRTFLDGQEDDARHGRHVNQSVNVGFVGGQVLRKKADDLFVEKSANGYNNLTPLWKPYEK